jgi:Skp family chaperone for outer membrane proteins
VLSSAPPRKAFAWTLEHGKESFMNRMLLAAALSAICVAVNFTPLAAQSLISSKPLELDNNGKAVAAGTTRVAVINLGYVFNKYERAATLKEELQTEVRKLQDDAKRTAESINVLQQAMAKGDFKNGTKESYEEKLINARRRLEDLQRTAQIKIGKQQQNQLMLLWADVRDAVKIYSAKQKIDLVFSYGDPLDKAQTDTFQNIDRKMRSVDAGGSTPFFMNPGVDISEAVTELLNRRYREEKEKTEEDPQDR